MATKIECDITKAVISPAENVGDTPLVVSYGGVELLVVARRRPDGSCPDLQARAIRVMVERGEIRPAPDLLQKAVSSSPAPSVEMPRLIPLRIAAGGGPH